MTDYSSTEDLRWQWRLKMSQIQTVLDNVKKFLEHFSKPHHCLVISSFENLETILFNGNCSEQNLNNVLQKVASDIEMCDQAKSNDCGFSSPVKKSNLEIILVRILKITGPYMTTEKIQYEMAYADFTFPSKSDIENATIILPPPNDFQDDGITYKFGINNIGINVENFPEEYYETALEEPSAPPLNVEKKKKYPFIKKMFSPTRNKNSGC